MERNRRRTALIVAVVCAIVLAGVYFYRADTCYRHSVRFSREAVLRQNLFTLRSLIHQYTEDKKEAPRSLSDLIEAGYLKRVPTDPMTGKADWRTDESETLESVDQQSVGVGEVHSASSDRACDGTAYNTW